MLPREQVSQRSHDVIITRHVPFSFFVPYLTQYLTTMFKTPTTVVWKRLYDEGKLKPPQTFFWGAEARGGAL